MTGARRSLARAAALAAALAALGSAQAQPARDPDVVAAFGGWGRAGRTMELDLRVPTRAAGPASIEIVAGRQTVRMRTDLEAGRTQRLHVPVGAADRVVVTVATPTAESWRREIAIPQSESPLLAVAVAAVDVPALEGFHAVAIGADALPRHASAYATIDAMVIDAATLSALDPRQLAALMGHVAQCGRVVLLDVDAALQRAVEGAAGCAGRMLMHASSPRDAVSRLDASLAVNVATASLPVAAPTPAPSAYTNLDRVLVGVAVYLVAATCALALRARLVAVLALPVAASALLLGMLHVSAPAAPVLVWSEAESGSRVARYQAWQPFAGFARGVARMPLAAALAGARPCDARQPVRLDFDPVGDRFTSIEYESRLFRAMTVCFTGDFVNGTDFRVERRSDGTLEVGNDGASRWPEGLLVAGGHVSALPSLAPGETAVAGAGERPAPGDRALRMAIERNGSRPAALWRLDAAAPRALPEGSSGWLLVSTSPR